jgi:hypothetical protein
MTLARLGVLLYVCRKSDDIGQSEGERPHLWWACGSWRAQGGAPAASGAWRTWRPWRACVRSVGTSGRCFAPPRRPCSSPAAEHQSSRRLRLAARQQQQPGGSMQQTSSAPLSLLLRACLQHLRSVLSQRRRAIDARASLIARAQVHNGLLTPLWKGACSHRSAPKLPTLRQCCTPRRALRPAGFRSLHLSSRRTHLARRRPAPAACRSSGLWTQPSQVKA